jgi:hypothetical protein
MGGYMPKAKSSRRKHIIRFCWDEDADDVLLSIIVGKVLLSEDERHVSFSQNEMNWNKVSASFKKLMSQRENIDHLKGKHLRDRYVNHLCPFLCQAPIIQEKKDLLYQYVLDNKAFDLSVSDIQDIIGRQNGQWHSPLSCRNAYNEIRKGIKTGRRQRKRVKPEIRQEELRQQNEHKAESNVRKGPRRQARAKPAFFTKTEVASVHPSLRSNKSIDMSSPLHQVSFTEGEVSAESFDALLAANIFQPVANPYMGGVGHDDVLPPDLADIDVSAFVGYKESFFTAPQRDGDPDSALQDLYDVLEMK